MPKLKGVWRTVAGAVVCAAISVNTVADDSLQPADINCESGGSYVSDQQDCTNLEFASPSRLDEVQRLYYQFVWNKFVQVFEDESWAAWKSHSVAVNQTCQDYDQKQFGGLVSPTWIKNGDSAHGVGEFPIPPVSNPIWDQNGNPVVFESRYNNKIQYIAPELVRFDGTVSSQLNALCTSESYLRLPWGVYGVDSPPPISLKLGWKKIDPATDDASKFILNPNDKTYGLVALHMVFKVNTAADTWLWATFGHVNNLTGDKPFFNDPTCGPDDCPANVCPTEKNGVLKTQVVRRAPIAPLVAEFNSLFQSVLGPNSVFSNYQLVGAQQPLQRFDENLPALPEPYVLSNEIIEWDRQASSCMGCHTYSRVWVLGDKPNQLDELCKYYQEPACGYELQSCEGAFCAYAEKNVTTSEGSSCDANAPARIPVNFNWKKASGNVLSPMADMLWLYIGAEIK